MPFAPFWFSGSQNPEPMKIADTDTSTRPVLGSGPVALLTGATGFVGSHLADLLLAEGWQVRCTIRKTSNMRWLADKPLTLVETDLFSANSIAQQLGDVEYIFHVAGVVKGRTQADFDDGNVTTTQAVLDAAAQMPVGQIKKIVVVSSLSATGPAKAGGYVDEKNACHPLTKYGRSKLKQELLCAEYMDKLPITIIRPPAIYGPRDEDVFLFFQSYKQRIIPTVWQEQTLSFVHVADVVQGLLLAALSPKAVGQTYFISSEKGYNWSDIAQYTRPNFSHKAYMLRLPNWAIFALSALGEKIGNLMNKSLILNSDKAREMIQSSWVCSPQKAIAELGYSQKVSLKVGIAQTIEWYKSQGWL